MSHTFPYYSADAYLKERFGEKIYKIALNAGFTCPNRDGTKGHGGCIYCSELGSREYASDLTSFSVHDALAEGRALFGEKKTGSRYIAYFQSYTNTYAPPRVLDALFREAMEEPDVVGISIATRPDCVNEECIAMLVKLMQEYPEKLLWLELGIQTIRDDTAMRINRCYPTAIVEDLLSRLSEANIPVILHFIVGLPGETVADLYEDISYVNHLIQQNISVFGIKLHMLHVIAGTTLAAHPEWYPTLTQDEYTDAIVGAIARLHPSVTVHRLTGDGPRLQTLAPKWSLNKRSVLNDIHRKLSTRGITQGCYQEEL